MAADFLEAGVPIAARLEAPASAEGGDTLWLDESTLLVGRGYRTNDEGIAQLARALPGVDVVAFDLPHMHGASEVMHLMSLLSPLDADLAVAYPPLMPVRLMELLAERGVELVEVPEEEFETMGPNVLALAPRVALALDGNDETRRRMEAAGVEVSGLQGRRDLEEGRRRPDLPDATVAARLGGLDETSAVPPEATSDVPPNPPSGGRTRPGGGLADRARTRGGRFDERCPPRP